MKLSLVIAAITGSLLLTGCAGVFKPADIDKTTQQFPAMATVDKEHIKIFQPLAGVGEYKFVYLRTMSDYKDEAFYPFIKNALTKIGFPKVYSDRELSQIVIERGMSSYVTDLSHQISLYNLSKAAGPFVVLECVVWRISDVVFRFDVQILDPSTGNSYLEISRVRTNWLDMDREINYPILNVIKQWYDESLKLPYDKPQNKLGI